MLDAGTARAREAAAIIAGGLARSERYRTLLIEGGCVPPILDTVKLGPEQTEACLLLSKLLHNEETQVHGRA